MPIDYSKWDHLEGDSESDEDAANANVTGPRVTRLEAASRVTFGGQQQNGWSTNPTGSLPVQVSSKNSDASNNSKSPTIACTGTSTESTNDSPSATNSSTRSLNQWTAKGGSLTTYDHRNLYWSQDRYSVHIRLELHPDEAIERVHVEGMLPYSDRHCATGSQTHRLNITGIRKSLPVVSSETTQRITILQGDLPHPVHWSQEDDSEGEPQTLDWEIERHPLQFQHRFFSITLNKAVPMNGLFIWWKRPLLQFDLPLRVPGEKNDQDVDISGHTTQFLEAWEEAHRIFRRTKRTQPTKQSI